MQGFSKGSSEPQTVRNPDLGNKHAYLFSLHFIIQSTTMPHLFSFIIAPDPALGRLDYDSLSDQALMEMLIDGMQEKDKKEFQDASGNFLDVCEWSIVTCTNKRVTSVNLSADLLPDIMETLLNYAHAHHKSERQHQKSRKKQFPFKFLPSQVDVFKGARSDLQGTLDTTDLPKVLRELRIAMNALYGTLSWSGLPRNLEVMNIEHNKFSGSLALNDLPQNLRKFKASANKFSGEIKISAIPPKLEHIDISLNKFEGSLDFSAVSPHLKRFDAGRNRFRGSIDLSKRPHSLEQIWLNRNALCGDILLIDAVGLDTDGVILDAGCFKEIKEVNGGKLKIQSSSVRGRGACRTILTIQGS